MSIANRTLSSPDFRLGASHPTLSTFARDITQASATEDQAWIMLITVVSDHRVVVLIIGPGRLRDGVDAVALAGGVLGSHTTATRKIVSRCRRRGGGRWAVGDVCSGVVLVADAIGVGAMGAVGFVIFENSDPVQEGGEL